MRGGLSLLCVGAAGCVWITAADQARFADRDSDGWPWDEDCPGDDDPAQRPDADEVCGDHVDQNCNGSSDDCGWRGEAFVSQGEGIVGIGADAALGARLAAGDIDGDGVTDLAVTGCVEPGGISQGVLFAGPLADVEVASDAIAAITIGQLNEERPCPVVMAPDLTGDGAAELIVAAPWWDEGPVPDAGSVWVFSAPSGLLDDDAAASRVYGEVEGLGVGGAVAVAEGHLAIGVPGFVGVGAEPVGRVEVYGTVIPGEQPAGSAGLIVVGVGQNAALGKALAAADWTGNGEEDLAAGAPGQGGTVVVFPPALTGQVPGDTLDVILRGEGPGDRAGESLAPAGDFNADGYEDLVIGAPGAGLAYVVHGPLRDSLDLAFAPSRMGFATAQSRAGTSVAGAGDVDGDGVGDLLVGAPERHDASDEPVGSAILIYGPLEGSFDLEDAPAEFLGESPQDGAGHAVAGLGDLDGDGYSDFGVGVPSADPGAVNAGAVYIFYGAGL